MRHQFRDGKINLVVKKDEMAFIHDALSSQRQRVNKIDPKMEYL